MGRIYWDDAPDPVAADTAAIREGVQTAYAANAETQREAVAFIVQHGAQVLGGHSPVNKPGRQGDPDNPLPDASDL